MNVKPYSLRTALSSCLLVILAASSAQAATKNGEEARWIVQSSKWGTLSWLEKGELNSLVTSIAESDGRIFFYLPEKETFKASLTLSEAQINPDQFFGARCGPGGDLDPEDPRCGKLTISGVISPVAEDSKQNALDALFATHPQMKDWPEDHGFGACEMKLHDNDGLWMIANFGGGGYMQASDYFASDPVHHPMQGFDGGKSRRKTRRLSAAASQKRFLEGDSLCYNTENHSCECTDAKCGTDLCGDAGGIWTNQCPGTCKCTPGGDSSTSTVSTSSNASTNTGTSEKVSEHGDGSGYNHGSGGEHHHGHHHGDSAGFSGDSDGLHHMKVNKRPDFGDDTAGHARWLVAKSLWTTVSTTSSKDGEQPFGNIRSIADGECFLGANGLPYFYVPSPDPTAKDIEKNNFITLSFTEAALAERVGEDGVPCGGKDAEDPTCAKLTLSGHAVPLDAEQVELAKTAFKAQHPRASWLSSGGGHTGGSYYTIHLHSIMFLRSYGGFAALTPDEYLNWKPDVSKYGEGEERCDRTNNKDEGVGSDGGHAGEYHHEHGGDHHGGDHSNYGGHNHSDNDGKWKDMMKPDILDDMPSPFDKAATACWLTHNIAWGVLSTINSRSRQGTPFGNVASFSDGAPGASTGNIYFLHSPLDSSMKDVMENDSVAFTMSEMQTGYCQSKKYDAEDPRCARLSLSGRLVKIDDEDEDEVKTAETALFAKHPSMRDWYNGGGGMHQFGFWKLEIQEIWLISFFGGATVVTPEAWERGTDKEGEKLFPTFMTCHDEHDDKQDSVFGRSAFKGHHPKWLTPLPFIALALTGVLLGFFAGRHHSYIHHPFKKLAGGGMAHQIEVEEEIKTVLASASLT